MGKIFAIILEKNEADIIRYTISHLFSQGMDAIIVRDNNSTDGTWEVLLEMQRHYGIEKLILNRDFEAAFYQGRKLTEMARQAVAMGAEWVVTVDGDELVYSIEPNRSVADQIRAHAEQCHSPVIGCALHNHYCSSQDKHGEVNPYRRMTWMYTERNPLDKCIVKYSPDMVIDEGNHRIFRDKIPVPGVAAGIAIRHFSARSCEQWIAKSISSAKGLEAARGLSQDIGAHCRSYKNIYDTKGPNALAHVFYTFFYYDLPNPLMEYSPAPYTGE